MYNTSSKEQYGVQQSRGGQGRSNRVRRRTGRRRFEIGDQEVYRYSRESKGGGTSRARERVYDATVTVR
jgi:hypothetical protein